MKNSLLKKFLLIILFLTFVSSGWTGGVIPAGRINYDLLYDQYERIDALSRDYFDYQLGPYTTDHPTLKPQPFSYLSPGSNKRLHFFSFAAEDFRSAKGSRGVGYETFRGGLTAQPHEKVFVYGNFLLDERQADDPTYTGKKYRGLAGGVEEAFAHITLGGFQITAGRFASFWGARNSLILSARNRLDGFGYTWRWGRIALSYRLAKLDGLNPDTDSVSQFENRYFAAHRLDVHITDWLRVAAFEGVVFGGPGRQIELNYLNPLIFFHSSQLNENVNDNTFMGFDCTVKPIEGLKLYGQLVVDDFQVDNSAQGDQEPSQFGLLLGGYYADVVPQFDLKVEYSRITNWTFNQPLERNRVVVQNDVLIGGALGNDYDLISLAVKRWFRSDLAANLHLGYLRQGEGSVTAEWTAPWLLVTGTYDERFPTGVVEKTFSFAGSVQGFMLNHFYVDATVGVDKITNYLNTDGDDRNLPFLQVRLSAFVDGAIDVAP